MQGLCFPPWNFPWLCLWSLLIEAKMIHSATWRLHPANCVWCFGWWGYGSYVTLVFRSRVIAQTAVSSVGWNWSQWWAVEFSLSYSGQWQRMWLLPSLTGVSWLYEWLLAWLAVVCLPFFLAITQSLCSVTSPLKIYQSIPWGYGLPPLLFWYLSLDEVIATRISLSYCYFAILVLK